MKCVYNIYRYGKFVASSASLKISANTRETIKRFQTSALYVAKVYRTHQLRIDLLCILLQTLSSPPPLPVTLHGSFSNISSKKIFICITSFKLCTFSLCSFFSDSSKNLSRHLFCDKSVSLGSEFLLCKYLHY